MVDKIDFSKAPKDRGYGYDSSFESDDDARERRRRLQNLLPPKKCSEKIPNKRQVEEEVVKEEGRIHRFHAVALDAFQRHKQYINNYILYYGGSSKDFQRDTSKDKRDIDVIKEHHQFLWAEDEESEASWEKRLAKKYYDKLFKEYCIADLSRYKENKIGMRWRTEKEVVDGKGQFVCGNKKCTEKEGLRSWEVNFGYVEHGEKKNALVKLRLCPDCSYKLNYHHKRKEILPKPRKVRNLTHVTEDGVKKQRLANDKTSSWPGESGSSSHKDRRKKDEKRETSDEEPGRSEDKGAGESGDGGIWRQPAKLIEEKSREDEFDDYFADMFL